MVYILKDLLVSVLMSEEKGVTPALGRPTTCIFDFPRRGEPPTMVGLLEALKAQLERALSDLDWEEESIGEQLQPRTLEQIEMLQSNFDRAQDELNRLRTEIANET